MLAAWGFNYKSEEFYANVLMARTTAVVVADPSVGVVLCEVLIPHNSLEDCTARDSCRDCCRV